VTLWCLLRARGVTYVLPALLVIGVVDVVLGSHRMPTIDRATSDYPSAVWANFSPVMASLAVLAATRSGMSVWDRRAGARFSVFLVALYLTLMAVAILALSVSALVTGEHASALSGIARGVCVSCGLGLVLSVRLDYLTLAMIVFSVGAVAINLVTLGAVHGRALALLPGPQDGRSALPAVVCLAGAVILAGVVRAPVGASGLE
jgi:hypothetical protein